RWTLKVAPPRPKPRFSESAASIRTSSPAALRLRSSMTQAGLFSSTREDRRPSRGRRSRNSSERQWRPHPPLPRLDGKRLRTSSRRPSSRPCQTSNSQKSRSRDWRSNRIRSLSPSQCQRPSRTSSPHSTCRAATAPVQDDVPEIETIDIQFEQPEPYQEPPHRREAPHPAQTSRAATPPKLTPRKAPEPVQEEEPVEELQEEIEEEVEEVEEER